MFCSDQPLEMECDVIVKDEPVADVGDEDEPQDQTAASYHFLLSEPDQPPFKDTPDSSIYGDQPLEMECDVIVKDEPVADVGDEDEPQDQTAASYHFLLSEPDQPPFKDTPDSSIYGDQPLERGCDVIVKDEPVADVGDEDEPQDQTAASSHFLLFEPDRPPIKDTPDSSIYGDQPLERGCDVIVKDEPVVDVGDEDEPQDQTAASYHFLLSEPDRSPFKDTPDSSIYDGKLYACNICDFKAKRRSNLKQHAKTHSDEKPYACNLCDYKAIQRSNLKRHVKAHSDEKPYACNICDYKAVQRSQLERHVKVHSDEKPYACNLCDFKAKRPSHLKQHVKAHSGDKPHVCDVCGYKTGHLGALKSHLKSHSDEKPYACDICDFKAKRRSHLKRHVELHSGEKPYACEICDYRGSRQGDLTTHSKIHTDEKPYTCDFCDYKTRKLGNLKAHVRTHTGEKPYPCDICEFNTGNLTGLKRHMKRIHGIAS